MDALVNLLTQAAMLIVVLVSMGFRLRGNYLVHGIIMIAAVAITITGTLVISATAPSGAMQALINTPMRLAVVSSHMAMAITTLVFGVWLVALWRPHSTTFAAKSKRQAQITTILWIATFLVGVLVFVTLHTTFFA
jgi:hypothetical protein